MNCTSCEKTFLRIGNQRYCAPCGRERRLAGRRKWYEKYKFRERERSKKWHKEHPEQAKALQTKRWADNKEYEYRRNQRWRDNNPEKIRETERRYRSARRQTDVGYKLANNLRSRLNRAIRRGQKAGSAVRDLGCTIEELKYYVELQFQPGMTWENWGRTSWHLDHIKPLAAFDLTKREQFIEACHYTNLQPLLALDNLRKGSK